MATSSMVPYSNPAGNNQTSPPIGVPLSGAGARGAGGKAGGALPMTSPIASPVDVAAQNPYVPAGTTVPSVPNVGGLAQSPTNVAGTTGALQKQLVDIYGKGVGGALSSLLDNMSGVDSTVLQQYIESLQPQFAKAQADLGASLGAGGVSANSSVAALGEANLQSQENALVAGESANLTQSQEQMTMDALMRTAPTASQEVATSGWDVFGNVMSDLGKLGATAITAAGSAGGFSSLFS